MRNLNQQQVGESITSLILEIGKLKKLGARVYSIYLHVSELGWNSIPPSLGPWKTINEKVGISSFSSLVFQDFILKEIHSVLQK